MEIEEASYGTKETTGYCQPVAGSTADRPAFAVWHAARPRLQLQFGFGAYMTPKRERRNRFRIFLGELT